MKKVNTLARLALKNTFCEIIKQNMGTLKEIFLYRITNEIEEGVSYLNALDNNVNLTRLESFKMSGNPSLFASDDSIEMICNFFSK